MIELLKQFDFTDGVIAVCFLCFVFLIWFRLYWNRNKGEFIENIEQLNAPKNKYKLKQKAWFYEGSIPSINESQIHTPDVLITSCMTLKWIGQNN